MDRNERAMEFFLEASERAHVISARWKTGAFHGVDGSVEYTHRVSPVETCVEQNEGEVIVRFFYAVDRNFDISPEGLFTDFISAQGLRFREQIAIEPDGVVATVIVFFDDEEIEPAKTPFPEVLAACAELVRKTEIYADETRLPPADPGRFAVPVGAGPEFLRNMAWLPINAFTDADFADDGGEDGHAEDAFLLPIEIDSDIPDRSW